VEPVIHALHLVPGEGLERGVGEGWRGVGEG
jgi:hypothetical protein